MQSAKQFTVYNQNDQDEYGIFLSILYLAGEVHKRKIHTTCAALLAAAESFIDSCSENDCLTNELSAALITFKQSLYSGNYNSSEIMASFSKD